MAIGFRDITPRSRRRPPFFFHVQHATHPSAARNQETTTKNMSERVSKSSTNWRRATQGSTRSHARTVSIFRKPRHVLEAVKLPS